MGVIVFIITSSIKEKFEFLHHWKIYTGVKSNEFTSVKEKRNFCFRYIHENSGRHPFRLMNIFAVLKASEKMFPSTCDNP